MKINHKILLGLISPPILALATAWLAASKGREIRLIQHTILNETINKMEALERIKTAGGGMAGAMNSHRRMLKLGQKDLAEQDLARFRRNREAMDLHKKTFADSEPASDAEIRTLLKELDAVERKIGQGAGEAAPELRPGPDKNPVKTSLGSGADAEKDFFDIIARMATHEKKEAWRDISYAQGRLGELRIILAAGLLASFLLLVWVASVILKSISAPISKLERAAAGLSKGDFGVRADITSRDEFGALASAFNAMAASLQERTGALALANKDLTEALANVKTLSGLLPICANCKKIRDDQGYWRQVEEYFDKHSEIKFSHGFCPACAKKLYPEFSGRIADEQKRDGPERKEKI